MLKVLRAGSVALEAMRDSFPKLLLVADRWRLGTTESGVQAVNVADWLEDER